MGIKIRNLKVKDNRLLVKMLKRLINECKQDWLENVVQEEAPSDPNSPVVNDEEKDKKSNEAFVVIINKLIDAYAGEITAWFASLLDMTVEEYEDLDFDTDLIVIEQMMAQPKFRFFFQKAFTMFNLTNLYEKLSTIVKERLDIPID